MSKNFRRNRFVTKALCAISAAAIVTGGIAFYLSKDTRVLASAVDEGKAVPANLDAVSAINYATILGRATDFGIVANDFEQVTHMETTFAVNHFTNTQGQVNEVDFITNTAQFMVGSVEQYSMIKFGQSQTASSYVLESTDQVFNNFNTEWNTGDIFHDDSNINSSCFYFDNAGNIWTGDNARPVYTIVKSEDAITTDINNVISNATASSNYISSRATDPNYALDYTQYLTIDNIGRDPYNPQDQNTGNPDQGNRFYIDIDKSEFVNRVVYINVDQNLARVMANSEGLCIIKDPSTVVVFNIEPGITSGNNGGLVLDRMCVSEDGGRNFCNTVTASQGSTDPHSKSSNLGTENNINFNNDDVDRMINQKIILNIRSDYSNIELNAVGGTVLVPNPNATANVRGSSSGWIVSAGHLRNEGGEWHYIYQGGSQDLVNITDGQQIHFAMHKDFTSDNGLTSDNSIYMEPDQFTFDLYDLGTGLDFNSINLNSKNGLTPLTASNQATGNVFFPSLSLTTAGDYYYLITEEHPGSSDGQVTNSDGYIKIHVHVEQATPVNRYTVTYAYYLHANDTEPLRQETNVAMMGVQFDLGRFFNLVETTGSITLNKTVMGITSSQAHETYTFYVQSGDTYYGTDANGNLRVSSSPIANEVHPGVPFVIRDLPLDRIYTVTESRSGIDVQNYDCSVSGEGTVALSAASKHGNITITNTYSGKFETGAVYVAKFGSDTNGAFLGGAVFELTSNVSGSNITVTGATAVDTTNHNAVRFTTVSTEAAYIEGLAAGTYTLTEVEAPEGYTAADPVEITVNRFGVISSVSSAQNVSFNSSNSVISITDEKEEPVPVTATVGISKKDTVAGRELPGASITITSNEGLDLTACVVTGGGSDITKSENTISFVSGLEATVIEGLPVGTYTMHEVTAPSGYQTTTDIQFTIDENGRVTGDTVTSATASDNAVVTMFDAPTQVDISKVAISTHEELPGAELHITCTDESVSLLGATVTGAQSSEVTEHEIVFVSGESRATITGLPNGTYILHEEVAPNVGGVQYVVATDIQFTIANGQVLSDGNAVTVATDSSNAVVTMVDDIFVAPTGTVDISKQATGAGLELPGAQITITNNERLDLESCVLSGGYTSSDIVNNVITFTSGNAPTTISGLPAGSYTMREISAPTGYALATSIDFTVGTDGSVTGAEVVESTASDNARITMLDAPIVVDFSKQDTVAGEELPGARITITGPRSVDLTLCTVTGGGTDVVQEGNTISYTSGRTPTTVTGLPFGTYTMHEVSAPDGYQTTTDINFTIAQDGTLTGSGTIASATATGHATVTMQDGPSVVEISKVATGATSELPGAQIQITCADEDSDIDLTVASVTGGAQNVSQISNVISFTSGDAPAIITGLPDGTYVMHEEVAPSGYVAATDIFFTIENGVVQRGANITTATNDANARVTMEDDLEVTEITGTVDISKKDTVAGEELPGARITITSNNDINLEGCTVNGGGTDIVKEDNTISFTSGRTPTTISGLPAGVYTMHEVTAPAGYQTATDIEFIVEADGSISASEITTSAATGNAVVTMLDAPIVAEFSKKDTVAGDELEGAQIQIIASQNVNLESCVVTGGGTDVVQEGNTITYVSGSEPTVITGLPAGNYTMVENAAPAGYIVSTRISFTIAADGTVSGSNVDTAENGNSRITMLDAPSAVEIDKVAAGAGTELPGAVLQITRNDDVSMSGARVQGGAQDVSVTDDLITFTSGDSAAVIYALPDGTYTLTETRAPNIDGVQYAVATSIDFTIENGVVQPGDNITVATDNHNAVVTMVDDVETVPGATVEISKVEAGSIEELPGAQLQIFFNGSENLSETVQVTGGAQSATVGTNTISFTSGDSAAVIAGLPDGTYTLHETQAPVIDGVVYDLATNIQFTISNGVVLEGAHITAATSSTNARVTMEDSIHVDGPSPAPTATVVISKVDASDLQELEGAQIQITCEGDTNDLREASVTGGAQSVLVEEHMISFVSGTSDAIISNLPDGTYRMHEEVAPDGYMTATDITFSIVNGVVQEGVGITVATDDSDAIVTMEDEAISSNPITNTLYFSKENVAGEELPGATLELTGPSSLENVTITGGGSVTSVNGDTIVFVSGSDMTLFEGLPNGDYTIVERVAPNINGVQYVETTIEFTLTNGSIVTTSIDARLDTVGLNNVIIMIDRAATVTEPDTCSLTLNKVVEANGASAPASYTFNVKSGDVYYGVDAQGNTISGAQPIAITVVPGTPVVLTELPNGDYEVSEVKTNIDVAGYSVNVTGEETVTLNSAATASAEVTIVNTYTAVPGSLTIVKDLADGAPASAASMTYSFTVTGPNGYSNVVSVTGEGSVVIDNLVPGSYVVTENTDVANIEGYTLTVNGSGAVTEVTAGSNATATVVNTYTEIIVPTEPTTVPSEETTPAPTESSAEVLPTVETTPAPVETTPAPTAEATAATTTVPTTTTTTEATTTTTAGITSMDINISKQDIAGAEIDGAVLTITNADGNYTNFLAAGVTATQDGAPAVGLEVTADSLQFTTVSSSQALIHDLPVGRYVLTETIAPRGYLIAESITFEVRNDGTIWVAGTSEAEMVERIVMKDLADPSYGASVLGAARETTAETTAESTSGSAARTGETIISATAVVAVVLFIAGGAVLILRKKINEIY